MVNTHEIVQQSAEIFGYMTKMELAWLSKKASSLPKGARWAELGSHSGRSLFAVGMSLPPGSTLVSVDSDWGRFRNNGKSLHEVFRRIQELRPGQIQLHGICTTTDHAALVFRPEYFDVVFLDADHSYKQVLADIENWSPLLKMGGTICGHDYADHCPGVRQAVEEAYPDFEKCIHSIWAASKSD